MKEESQEDGMAEEGTDDELLKKYLLGELDQPDQQSLEENLLTDASLFESLAVVEDELVDAYLDNELSPVERRDFERFFMTTEERRQKLRFAMNFRRYRKAVGSQSEAVATSSGQPSAIEPPAIIKPRTTSRWTWAWHSRYARVAIAAVILAAAGIGLIRFLLDQRGPSKGLIALRDAYSSQRPTEARISDWKYAPPPPLVRGDEPESVDYVARDRADNLIREQVEHRRDAQSLQDLGRLYLTQHKYNEAIDQFRQALALDDSNAQVHSDYAAALLELGKAYKSKGEAGQAAERFGQSSEQLVRAIELNNSLLEALFNRALCDEYLMLYREAEHHWEAYLEKDGSSKWADEARDRLQKLQNRRIGEAQAPANIIREFIIAKRANDRQRAWQLVCQNRGWSGDAIASGFVECFLQPSGDSCDKDARESLTALAYAGDVIREHSGDLFARDAVAFYGAAGRAARNRLLEARKLLGSGTASFRGNKFEDALDSYSRARDIFAREGDSADQAVAMLAIANAYLQQQRTAMALSVAQPLVEICERASWRFLLAQAFYLISQAHQNVREFSAAIQNTNRSIKLSEEMNDSVGVLKARFQLAEINRFLNKNAAALDVYFRDLPQASALSTNSAQLWGRYFSISRAFDEIGGASAALSFQNEALQIAIETGDARLICRSRNYLGFILGKSHRYDEARDCIARALELANTLSEKRARLEASGYSLLQLGYLSRQTRDFANARDYYDRAIACYDALDSEFFSFTARKGRLLCCIDSNDCPDVERDLETLLTLFEKHRSKILEESSRNTFFDAEQTIYDVAIDFEFARKHDPWKAFEYSERSRGRSLNDLAVSAADVIQEQNNPDIEFTGVTPPMDLDQIRAGTPAESQILQYAVLNDRIVMWVVNHGTASELSREVAVQEISLDDLSARVKHFRELVVQGAPLDSADLSSSARELYDLLVEPVRPWLNEEKELCIVADKILNDLPFAALLSPSGRYLIQEQKRGIVFSPSATMFVRCSSLARRKSSRSDESLLSVGDPEFERAAHSNLDRLASAAREAEMTTRYYGNPPALTGAAGTKARVMADMQRVEVIHLATHAISDPWNSLRSSLLLATSDSASRGDDVVEACELYKLDLSRVKLVVLSACQTAADRYYSGEGMIGLARPFIARGAPLVVASLWPVDSDATAQLMVSFHKHRKLDPLRTTEALREAQLEMLNNGRSSDSLPRNWAAFVVLGGHAEF
jgi:CHAT domain-containing protein